MSKEIMVVGQPSALDGLLGRVNLCVSPGTTIAEIVERVFPGISDEMRNRLRVTIGDQVVFNNLWHMVKPKPKAHVRIVAVAGNDILRNVLTIAVTVAAVALGQVYAPALVSASGGFLSANVASGLITASTLVAGTLLINALIPTSTKDRDKPIYSIQGLRNQLTPNGVVPLILGKVRIAPPYAAKPYTQAVGDYRYVIAAFCCGYGPLLLENWNIGNTPISRYLDFQIETRQGYSNDLPLSIYPRQVSEEGLNIELLTSQLPTGGEQIRATAADCISCEIDTSYPSGVYGKNKTGESVTFTVAVVTRYRPSGSGDADWIVGPQIVVTGKKMQPLLRTTPIVFPYRGRWEVGLTRTTTDWDSADQSKKDIQRSGRSYWSALRSFRPEYPINFPKPLALSAVRIRATAQLQGTLDELSVEATSICPDWDSASQSWITRPTNNPASLFRYVLSGPAAAYPLSPDDLQDLSEWHEYCASRALCYNRKHDYEASILEVLADVAAAGRASPHDDGNAWGVVIDRAMDFVSAHISPRNSWGFQAERSYVKYPDAFRVSFLDETNYYQNAERIVPWPGFDGVPDIVESLSLPGVTNPDQIYKEARRRQYELIYRLDTFTINQDVAAIGSGVSRGDRVELSHDVLDRVQVAGKILAVNNRTVTVDEVFNFELGFSYACRFQDLEGNSFVSPVRGFSESRSFTIDANSPIPDVGTYAFFGQTNLETLSCTVKGTEAMDKFCSRITLVAHAPEIESLTDATVPPVWSGRVGDEAQEPIGTPQAPIIVSIVSGRQASDQMTEDNPYPIVVLVQASTTETQTITTFQVRHRTVGVTAWTTESAPASAGAVLIDGYTSANKGTQVEVQAQAIASQNTAGPWTDSVVHVIAATDPAAPLAPSNLSVDTPSAGVLRVTVTSSSSTQTAATQLYIATGANAAFSSAIKTGSPINSGPNTTLPPYSITGLSSNQSYRLWATALDSDTPPNESVPIGPVTKSTS